MSAYQKRKSLTQRILDSIRKMAVRNAGIPSIKGIFEAKVPGELRRKNDSKNVDMVGGGKSHEIKREELIMLSSMLLLIISYTITLLAG